MFIGKDLSAMQICLLGIFVASCDLLAETVPFIHRCYVEFRRSPSQTNAMLHPVLPAVYLAIKMRFVWSVIL